MNIVRINIDFSFGCIQCTILAAFTVNNDSSHMAALDESHLNETHSLNVLGTTGTNQNSHSIIEAVIHNNGKQ